MTFSGSGSSGSCTLTWIEQKKKKDNNEKALLTTVLDSPAFFNAAQLRQRRILLPLFRRRHVLRTRRQLDHPLLHALLNPLGAFNIPLPSAVD